MDYKKFLLKIIMMDFSTFDVACQRDLFGAFGQSKKSNIIPTTKANVRQMCPIHLCVEMLLWHYVRHFIMSRTQCQINAYHQKPATGIKSEKMEALLWHFAMQILSRRHKLNLSFCRTSNSFGHRMRLWAGWSNHFK